MTIAELAMQLQRSAKNVRASSVTSDNWCRYALAEFRYIHFELSYLLAKLCHIHLLTELAPAPITCRLLVCLL